MKQQPQDSVQAEQLYRLVVEYDRKGDVYNAAKLCKRLAKIAPDWSVPFAFLGRMYRFRHEWRPTLHYCRRALEHNPFDENLWETLGLAATALGDWATARYAWNQLGFACRPGDGAPLLDLGLVPARLNPLSQPEVVAARRIDPVRAIIESVPQPSSGRRYKDLILIDKQPNQRYSFHQKSLALFDEVQLVKQSHWLTFSVLLHTDSQAEVDLLANLCLAEGLGFDNWSNASRFFQPNLHHKVSEYFDQAVFGKLERETFLVAVAAKEAAEVAAVLKSWRVITLKEHGAVEWLF